MKKLKIQLIFFQILGTLLIILGCFRIVYYFYSDFYKSSISNKRIDMNVYSEITNVQMTLALIAPILIVLTVSILNYKRKISALNSILLFVLIILLFLLHAVNNPYLNPYINSFGYIFVNDFKTAFLITSLTCFILGGILIKKSYDWDPLVTFPKKEKKEIETIDDIKGNL